MKAFIVSLVVVMATPLSAQDVQNRSVMHVMADINNRWFIPVWSITNVRAESPNNTNVFAGLGYRGKTWWTEGLVQHQLNRSGGLWSVDARFRRQFGRVSVYVEPSVIIAPKKAFYEFVIVEERLWKGLSLRQETENVHRPGKDTITAGGGLAYSLGKWRGFDVATALVYRASPTGKDELRAYLNITRRVRLH